MANNETKETLMKKMKNLQDGIEFRDKQISELMEESEEKTKTIKTLKESSKFIEEAKKARQELEEKINQLMEESEEKTKTIKELKEAIRYNKEHSKFVEEVQNVRQEYEGKIRDLKAMYQDKDKEFDVVFNTILREHKATVDRYESLLRILQGSLDSHLELSDLSNKSIEKYYNKEK